MNYSLYVTEHISWLTHSTISQYHGVMKYFYYAPVSYSDDATSVLASAVAVAAVPVW